MSDSRNTLSLCKASSIADETIDGVTIVIDRELPDNLTGDEWESVFMQQAESLVNYLEASLPQGVLDRVLAVLCARRASLYKVPLNRTAAGDLESPRPSD